MFSKRYNLENKMRRSINDNNVHFNTQKNFYNINQTPIMINNKMDFSKYMSNQDPITSNSYFTNIGKRNNNEWLNNI